MWYNPLVTWLLRSPLHRLMDGNTSLTDLLRAKVWPAIHAADQLAQDGQRLQLITRRQKRWWRNVACRQRRLAGGCAANSAKAGSVTPASPPARLADHSHGLPWNPSSDGREQVATPSCYS
jgi:hypothetical protein